MTGSGISEVRPHVQVHGQRGRMVRNCWYVAGWSHEFDDAALHARMILGEPVMFYRIASGGLIALEDRCRHRLAPLSRGRREGDAVRCMYHGMKFAADGRCVEIPGQDAIPAAARVRSYPVVETGGWTWIWMGDATLADAALLPAVVALDDPRFLSSTGQLDYDANFKLINDNLLDFSHLSFVHQSSFGDSPAFADSRPKVTAIDRGVRIGRWIPADPTRGPAPTQAAQGASDPVDQWQCYDYVVPGVMILRSEIWPAGTASAMPNGPMGDPMAIMVSCQAVTPISERQTRYFFTAGTNVGADAERRRDRFLKITVDAFDEDRFMIEGQQAIIDADPDRQIMPTTIDKAAIIFDRIMAQIDNRR